MLVIFIYETWKTCSFIWINQEKFVAYMLVIFIDAGTHLLATNSPEPLMVWSVVLNFLHVDRIWVRFASLQQRKINRWWCYSLCSLLNRYCNLWRTIYWEEYQTQNFIIIRHNKMIVQKNNVRYFIKRVVSFYTKELKVGSRWYKNIERIQKILESMHCPLLGLCILC